MTPDKLAGLIERYRRRIEQVEREAQRATVAWDRAMALVERETLKIVLRDLESN